MTQSDAPQDAGAQVAVVAVISDDHPAHAAQQVGQRAITMVFNFLRNDNNADEGRRWCCADFLGACSLVFQRNASGFGMLAHPRVKIPSGNITNLPRKLIDNEQYRA